MAERFYNTAKHIILCRGATLFGVIRLVNSLEVKIKDYYSYTVKDPEHARRILTGKEDVPAFRCPEDKREMNVMVVDYLVDCAKEGDSLKSAYSELQRTHLTVMQAIDDRLKPEQEVGKDALTGMYTKEYLDDALEREVARARRYCTQLSMVYVKIEGEAVNDNTLKQMARIIQDSARESDLGARYNGQEFALLLPETEIKEGTRLASSIHSEFNREMKEAGKKNYKASTSTVQLEGEEDAGRFMERASRYQGGRCMRKKVA
jgi:diguanylate cyclase (GGDEF)-like protein